MNERIICADHLVSVLSDTVGVIIILEHADLEVLIEQANSLQNFPSQRYTEHCQHRDRKQAIIVFTKVVGGPKRQIRQSGVSNRDLCFVAYLVCDRTNQANMWIGVQ